MCGAAAAAAIRRAHRLCREAENILYCETIVSYSICEAIHFSIFISIWHCVRCWEQLHRYISIVTRSEIKINKSKNGANGCALYYILSSNLIRLSTLAFGFDWTQIEMVATHSARTRELYRVHEKRFCAVDNEYHVLRGEVVAAFNGLNFRKINADNFWLIDKLIFFYNFSFSLPPSPNLFRLNAEKAHTLISPFLHLFNSAVCPSLFLWVSFHSTLCKWAK